MPSRRSLPPGHAGPTASQSSVNTVVHDFLSLPGSARKQDRRDSSTGAARLLKSFSSAGRIRSSRERGTKSNCRIRFKFRRTTVPFGAASPQKLLEDFANCTDLSNHSGNTLGSCPKRLKKRSCSLGCGLDLGVAAASRVGLPDARRIRDNCREPPQWIRIAKSF